jgi:hypothetical protein
MQELSGVFEAADLAMARFRLIQPYLEFVNLFVIVISQYCTFARFEPSTMHRSFFVV